MLEYEEDIRDETQAGAIYTLVFTVLASAALVVVALFFMRSDTSQNITLKPETPRQAYLSILGETHTGLRLARLDDFIDNVTPNANTPSAKAAREALTANEQTAWAKLTHELYDLKTTEQQKTLALTTYKTTWGIWSRQEDLPKLLQATLPTLLSSDDARYAPNGRRSKFSKDSHKTAQETMLAGAVPTTTAQPPATLIPRKPVALNIQPPRIKYAKRPRYPRRARRKGIEAVITLALDIDERGNVARTRVVSVSAPRYKDNFVRAAKRAAMRSKFHPKTVGDRSVASRGYLRKYAFEVGS